MFTGHVDIILRLAEGTTENTSILAVVGPYVWSVILGQSFVLAIPIKGSVGCLMCETCWRLLIRTSPASPQSLCRERRPSAPCP